MKGFVDSPVLAVVLGTGLALALLLLASLGAGLSGHQAGVMLVRIAHAGGAIVWGGFVVFVNLVQLAALKASSETERPVIVRQIVPRTARVFTIAADVTLLTGLIMLAPFVAGLSGRPLLLLGVAGGIAMWAIVRFVLKPAIARVTGQVSADDGQRAAARSAIALWARVNLVLLLPVTVAMLLAGHGFG